MNFIFDGWKSKGSIKKHKKFVPPPRIDQIDFSRNGELTISFDQDVVVPDFASNKRHLVSLN